MLIVFAFSFALMVE